MVNFSSEKWFTDSGFYPHEIEQSCRFDAGGSGYLSRTPSSASNQRTFTWSGWVKKVAEVGTATIPILSAYNDGSNFSLFRFASDKLQFYTITSGTDYSEETSGVFRDCSSWYHIVLRVDTTQSTASSRIRIYVNGTLQTTTQPHGQITQNYDTFINSTNAHNLGRNLDSTSQLLDGYLAEVHFTDGVSNAPSAFGETKEGVWVAKAYTGSYGTNGYYLKFDQTGTGTASASTIGADSSGEDNHFTSTNLASIDSNRTDSPTNNFATWNPLLALDAANYGETGTLVNGALELDADDAEKAAWSTMTLPSSGKYYVEMRCSSTTNFVGGIMAVDGNINRSVLFQTDGTIDHDNAQVQSSLTSYTDGNTIGMRLDMDSGTIAFYLQDSAYGSAVTISSYTQDYALMCYGRSYVNFRTDPRDFAYSIPSGYSTLSTANLPEPTISPLNGDQPSDHFDTVLYTGNATDDTAIAVPFQPDFVWIKKRSDAQEHVLFDAIRGATKRIHANLTNAETTEATTLKAFTSTGFTLGNHSSVNDNTETFASWNWLGANGTTSNSDGDITSTVSANTTAGFSIVKWASSNYTQTVGHGLSQAPDFFIMKEMDSRDWMVYHSALGNSNYLVLNNTNASTGSNNGRAQVSGTDSIIAGIDGTNAVAYCFHGVEGYSKIGSYTGNGSTDGTFVYTGFRPAFIFIKRTDSTSYGSWLITDNKRDETNDGTNTFLYPNLSNAEYGGSLYYDTLSNGFKNRSTTGANINSGTYIYLAIAEMPFKYANGR